MLNTKSVVRGAIQCLPNSLNCLPDSPRVGLPRPGRMRARLTLADRGVLRTDSTREVGRGFYFFDLGAVGVPGVGDQQQPLVTIERAKFRMRERAATQIVVVGDDEGAGALARRFKFGDQLGEWPATGGANGFRRLEAHLARFGHELAQRVVLPGPIADVRGLAGVAQCVFQPAHHAELRYVDVLETFSGGPAAGGIAVFELGGSEAVDSAEQRLARVI